MILYKISRTLYNEIRYKMGERGTKKDVINYLNATRNLINEIEDLVIED
ncbi:MAG: hypothetical protein GY804_02425 [Alphaproteobacteria bacterium]|nr:hypothetical protein [Alphaproteobacteria bacterium]